MQTIEYKLCIQNKGYRLWWINRARCNLGKNYKNVCEARRIFWWML